MAKLWSALYGMVWLSFLQIWLAYTPIAPPVPYYVHIVLGFGVVGLAYRNSDALRATTVPGRVKRIAGATFGLSVVMALLGIAIAVGLGGTIVLGAGITGLGILRFFHFVNAMAILTQASAAAIAFDMWEDREFLQETRPGEVPPAPRPA